MEKNKIWQRLAASLSPLSRLIIFFNAYLNLGKSCKVYSSLHLSLLFIYFLPLNTISSITEFLSAFFPPFLSSWIWSECCFVPNRPTSNFNSHDGVSSDIVKFQGSCQPSKYHKHVEIPLGQCWKFILCVLFQGITKAWDLKMEALV